MKAYLVLLLSVLGGAPASAQGLLPGGVCASGQCLPPPRAARQVRSGLHVDPRAIVRVANDQGRCRALGTGTLVDADIQQGVVVTCAHLFRDGVGRLEVIFASGRALEGRLLKLDAAADLAAVAIASPGVEPIVIATRSPQRGDPLVSCGLGGDGQLWCNRGTTIGYVTATGSHGTETLELSGSARQGDSGGPVLDQQHQLVAVIFGTNGQVVEGTFCGRVRRFLADVCPRICAPPVRSAPERAPATNRPSPPLDVDSTPSAAPPHASPAAPRDHPTVTPPTGQEPRQADTQSPAADDGLGRGMDAVEAAARPWLSAKLTAVLISLGVPGGIAGLAAGAAVWLVMRRGKKRLQARLDRLERGRTEAVPDATLQLQPAVVERHHNQYVPYEATLLDKAWSAAHAHVGERYPGAVPYLKLVEGVKDQLISGETNPDLS
jgi:hypothetical protein